MNGTDQLGLELPREPMPRLSDTMRCPPALNRCQYCGRVAERAGDFDVGAIIPDRLADGTPVVVLERWQEHDDRDQPEGRVVILCRSCSDRVVEPHPRLYRQLEPCEPFPGAHGLCVGCVNRIADTHLGCRAAQLNGGEGLRLRGPRRGSMVACRTGGRDRGCSHTTFWSGPVEACSRRKEDR